MKYRVVFSPDAQQDLLQHYEYLAGRFGDTPAFRYVERIEAWCNGLQSFPTRGRKRDDIRPGLRLAGFERRASIAFHLGADTVTVLRILYGGRDISLALATSGDE